MYCVSHERWNTQNANVRLFRQKNNLDLISPVDSEIVT